MVTSWSDMCPFYKKDVFLFSNTGSLEEKTWVLPWVVKPMTFWLLTSPDALPLSYKRLRELSPLKLITHGWYKINVKILTWRQGFRDKVAIFSWLHCLANPRGDLSTKKTKPNLVIWPESLGVIMLEFWFIKGGLLDSCDKHLAYC